MRTFSTAAKYSEKGQRKSVKHQVKWKLLVGDITLRKIPISCLLSLLFLWPIEGTMLLTNSIFLIGFSVQHFP